MQSLSLTVMPEVWDDEEMRAFVRSRRREAMVRKLSEEMVTECERTGMWQEDATECSFGHSNDGGLSWAIEPGTAHYHVKLTLGAK